MTSTYSPDLRLELMATGDQSGTWGTTTNTNLGTLLEQAICGVLSVAEGDATLTLTALNGASDQSRNAVVILTGAMTAGRNVVVPTSQKLYLFKNSTTGGFSTTVKTVSGTGVAIVPGSSQWVYCDGTNVVQGLVGDGVPDANNNITANSFVPSYAATATVAGTTTLTVASAYTQSFTGTATQTVVMPVASTLTVGQSWLLANDSVVPIAVQSSGGNTIQQLPAGQRAVVVCILASGTAAASWDMNVYGAGRRTRRNRLVNPAMQISQQNATSGGTTTGLFAADQWQHFFVSSSGTFTVRQVNVGSPQGSPNRIRETITVADSSLAAGEYLILTQNIEGYEIVDFLYGGASARPAVMRFGFNAPAGTYSISLQNAALNRSFVQTFVVSVANTDTYYSIPVPGDTTGTWGLNTSGLGLSLNIVLAAGSTFQGTNGAWQAGNILGTSSNTNGMASNTNIFDLFDVQLHLDVDGTGVAPGWELPEYGQALSECQRFFEMSFAQGTAPAQNVSLGQLEGIQVIAGANGQAIGAVRFAKTKRGAPTVVFFNPAAANAQIRNNSKGTDWSSTSTLGTATDAGFSLQGTGASGSAAGDTYGFQWTASARY